MKYKYLDGVNSPSDIKGLDYREMECLSDEIRDYIIEVITKNGGHLASNLGVVELTLALHRVFDSPKDKMIWDVGHQSYVHKILTGRRDAFSTIRLYEGLSGFPKRSESDHDIFETGHSSTSISAALGIAQGRDLMGEDYSVIAIIGDGAMTGGMAFEALNHAGHLKSRLIVILNDNDMSISKNIGAMSKYLSKIRIGSTYFRIKNRVSVTLKKLPFIGKPLYKLAEKTKELFKYIMVPGILFERLGFKYIGPVDGHDLPTLESVLSQIRDAKNGPILLHVVTKKGKGMEAAENSPSKYHGLSPKKNVLLTCSTDDEAGFVEGDVGFSEVFGEKLTKLAKEDDRVVAVSAAMIDGTGLKGFAKELPDRIFDVGIAEQHGVTFSAGLSEAGFMPVFAVYSTFLQRAYDQMIHDVAMQELPFLFAIDRAGLVGADGETHHGVFDVSYTTSIPGFLAMSPKDGQELEDMLEFSIKNRITGSIRYPRGKAYYYEGPCERKPIVRGELEIVREGEGIAILTEGCSFKKGWTIAQELKKDGYQAALVNLRFLNPLDYESLKDIGRRFRVVVVIEENIKSGGVGEKIGQFLLTEKYNGVFLNYSYPDEFMKHGDVELLEADYQMNWESIHQDLLKHLEGV